MIAPLRARCLPPTLAPLAERDDLGETSGRDQAIVQTKWMVSSKQSFTGQDTAFVQHRTNARRHRGRECRRDVLVITKNDQATIRHGQATALRTSPRVRVQHVNACPFPFQRPERCANARDVVHPRYFVIAGSEVAPKSLCSCEALWAMSA